MTHSIQINLSCGAISGSRLVESGEAICFFGNIPYAQSPFGTNRFHAPKSTLPWLGARDCTAFGPAAPQAPRVADSLETIVGGEECLTLNVWAPEVARGLPVFVVIPGGGFMRGQASDPLYDGASFAARGVVVVSLNYRIGIDGFMQFDDVAANEVAVNRGLLDQVAAIQWVMDNIAAFGGDASQITLGGVSAGAGSIVHLLGVPRLQGKIKRAILQSPSITCQTVEEAAQSRRAIARLLGCEPTLARLRAEPLHRVVRVVARLLAEYDLREAMGMSPKHFFPLRPVADGVLAQADPLAHLRGLWTQAGGPPDILVGANADEMNFYLVPDGDIDRVTWARVEQFARAVGLDASAWAQQGYPGERLAQLQSNHYYQAPARRIAALTREVGGRAHEYQFAWRSQSFGRRMGAAHAMEMPFAFNRLRTERATEWLGSAAPQRLADEMHSAWATFARGETLSEWPTNEARVFT